MFQQINFSLKLFVSWRLHIQWNRASVFGYAHGLPSKRCVLFVEFFLVPRWKTKMNAKIPSWSISLITPKRKCRMVTTRGVWYSNMNPKNWHHFIKRSDDIIGCSKGNFLPISLMKFYNQYVLINMSNRIIIVRTL